MADVLKDDLFEGSTMTFGEHLEELRSSLLKAVLWLVVGIIVGLLVARYVVLAIQMPLTRALNKYYRSNAVATLGKTYGANIPIEVQTLIDENGLVPDVGVKVDPDAFLRRLRADYPDRFEHIPDISHILVPSDISPEDVGELCAAIVKDGRSSQAPPGKAVWRLLPDDARKRMESLAGRKKVTDKERLEIVRLLNELLDRRSLHESKELEDLSFLPGNGKLLSFISHNDVEEAVKRIRKDLRESFDPVQSRRLNRLLLWATYPRQIRRPRVHLVELSTWKPAEVRVQTLSAQEAFMIWLKAAFISGVVIASPAIFWHIWAFVAAGLYPHEKRYVWIYLPFSLALFLAGVALAFFFVFDYVLNFLFSFNRWMQIDPDPRISEWLSFVLFLPVGFGIAFQLPLVMLFLHRIGIFTIENYLSKWRIAILVIFVASMLLTPSDPVSMLLMALPLTVLYFGGVALCKWMPRGRNPFAEPVEP